MKNINTILQVVFIHSQLGLLPTLMSSTMGAWIIACMFLTTFMAIKANPYGAPDIIVGTRTENKDAESTTISYKSSKPFKPSKQLYSDVVVYPVKVIPPLSYSSINNQLKYEPDTSPYIINSQLRGTVSDVPLSIEVSESPETTQGKRDNEGQGFSETISYVKPLKFYDQRSSHLELHSDQDVKQKKKEVHYHQHKHMHEHEHQQEHLHKHKQDHLHQHKHGHKHSAKHDHQHWNNHEHHEKGEHIHKHEGKHQHAHKAEHHHDHKQEHKHGHQHYQKHDHQSKHKHDHSHKDDHHHDHHSDHHHGHQHEHKHEGKHKHSHKSENKHYHDHKHSGHHQHSHDSKHQHKHSHQGHGHKVLIKKYHN